MNVYVFFTNSINLVEHYLELVYIIDTTAGEMGRSSPDLRSADSGDDIAMHRLKI